ncbi:unnamed protein product [Ambrosiozyma monospora]|uniref:Unnamed protein product n=1 Tax=Ambrosiozyma monospora TaxID=43982 RepID=A0ACB5SUX9_AMBMO|nr:unnamed protein product [Ambrosiozyma monospora]
MDEFNVSIDMAKRIMAHNQESSSSARDTKIRTTCTVVDQGECIIQGNGITCCGYYVCFELEPDVQAGEMVRFDKEVPELAHGGFEMWYKLADLGIDGNTLKDEQLGFLNGEVWISDLE